MIEISMTEEVAEGLNLAQSAGCSLSLAARVEVQIEAKLGESLEAESQQNTVFFFAASVVPHHRSKRSSPVGEIAIKGITLLLENSNRPFVLFLKSKPPIVADPVISSDHK